MLELIKGERELSFNHWRYKILHWCFGVNPDSPENSALPRFLYTHYCPLFHLTNLIAIFSPIILVIKLLTVLFCGIGKGVQHLFDAAITKAEAREQQDKKDNPIKYEKGHISDWIVRQMKYGELTADRLYFSNYWMIYGPSCEMPEEEAENYFNGIKNGIIKKKERSEKRRAEMQKRIVFWVNFSRGLLKWAMNGIYIALVCWMVYLGWTFSASIASFFGSIFSVDSFWFVMTCAKFGILGAVVAVVLLGVPYFIWKHTPTKVGEVVKTGTKKAVPALDLTTKVIVAPFVWLGKGIVSCVEFVRTFYEESCPPIKIVKDEEVLPE